MYHLANRYGRGSGSFASLATDTFVGDTDVDPDTDRITVTGHAYTTGDPVRLTQGAGTAPVGLVDGNVYFVIVVDVNTIQLSRTLGGVAVNITADGSGTITLTDVEMIEFRRGADFAVFAANGTNFKLRSCLDISGETQFWKDWTAGVVSVPTEEKFDGARTITIEGTNVVYSYAWK